MNGKDHYDLNCINHITKYVSAHLFVEKRTLQKCKESPGQIKITCYDQMLEIYNKEKHKPKKKRKPITFVCDKFGNYKSAWSILFGRVGLSKKNFRTYNFFKKSHQHLCFLNERTLYFSKIVGYVIQSCFNIHFYKSSK